MQAEKIKQSLEDMNVFNAGKNREEALEALATWLPEAEKFSAQTKNPQDHIDRLMDKNYRTYAGDKGKDEPYPKHGICARILHRIKKIYLKKRSFQIYVE